MTRKEHIAHALAEVLERSGWTIFDSDSTARRCVECDRSSITKGDYCAYCGSKLPEALKSDQEVINTLFEAFEAGAAADLSYDPREQKVEVKVGQVWEDNDKRQRDCPRRGTVEKVIGGYAIIRWDTGRSTQISLKRLRPNSTGYRLVED